MELRQSKEKPVGLIKDIRNLGSPYKPKKMTNVNMR